MSQLSTLLAEINTDLGTPITRTMLIAALRDLANVSSSSSMTRAEAMAYSFTNPPEILHTVGYATAGDYGGAAYQKVDTFTTPVNGLGNNVGTFTTADGTKYQMIPTSNDVYANAFGAKSHASSNVSFDNWQFFEDCKYWIIAQTDESNLRGIAMRTAPGCYYLTKAHSIEGAPYSFIGAGVNSTMFRFPWNSDGIQIQHCWATQSVGHEAGPVAAGTTMAAGLEFYWPGSPNLYVVRTAGNIGAATTATGTGITSGTAVIDYVRALSWSETRNTGAAGGMVSDFTAWGRFDRNDPAQNGRDEDQTVPGGGYHCGILMRTRCTVARVWTASFVGHGIAVIADGDREVRGGGNANQWRLDRVSSYWNGHDGVHIGLADANAGIGIDIDTASNLRWGVADWSFLGNRWVSLQAAYDGTNGAGAPHPGMCTHNGYIWLARLVGEGGDLPANYHNEPGTDPNSWTRLQGDGQQPPAVDWPVWSSTTRFVPNGAFCSNNINAPSQWLGLYIEGGTNPPQFAAPNVVWGGIGVGNSGHGEQVYGAGFTNTITAATQYAGADGLDGFSAGFGPRQTDAGNVPTADSTIFSFQGGGNQLVLGGVKTTVPPTIVGSIADVVASSAVFTGQIGVGDAMGANVWQNILFVTATASGTILPGQIITGAGIPAGTTIGAASWWPNSYNILPGDGVPIGTNGTGAGGITSEAMSSQFVLPVLTVTSCPTDAISPGAKIDGGGLPSGNPTVQIAKQLDPTTLANIPFTGGVGKYALSCGGRTVASTTFNVWPNGMHNIDFALSSGDDAGLHVWGWTGRASKRKFGRVNPVQSAFFARKIILGEGQNGMDNGNSRVFQMTGGAPDNGGDYKTGEFRFNYNYSGGAGTPILYVFLGADTGITGTPKWFPLGSVS